MKYLDDFSPGDEYDLGSVTVSEEEIIAFAQQFDPQPFHIDTVAARESPFGGIIASGWHTSSLYMRLAVDSMLTQTANVAGLGVDDLRWLQPVRPGDTLTARATVLEVQPSTSRPDRGVLVLRMEFTNQRDELVWHTTSRSLTLRRP